MLEKQELCKDYMQGLEPCWKLCDAPFLTFWERESRHFNDESTSMCGMQSSGLINEDGTAKFKYEFKFGNDEVVYKYSRFANTELCDEELYINGEAIFKFDFKNSKFDLA